MLIFVDIGRYVSKMLISGDNAMSILVSISVLVNICQKMSISVTILAELCRYVVSISVDIGRYVSKNVDFW